MVTGKKRIALVLSGGGARGAYEAGILSYILESVYPKLAPEFEFDIISGTSVGAVHAAYMAASSGMDLLPRSSQLLATWRDMTFDSVFKLSWRDLVSVPLRFLGLSARESGSEAAASEAYGGLVDVSPLEDIVRKRIPWGRLRDNLNAGKPGALCVSATDIGNGRVLVFLDGMLADPSPWEFDPYAEARAVHVTERHVRASAAIPFLFPSVRIEDSYFVDGGLRLNTPLSPALRLRADKIVVVGLKYRDKEAAPLQRIDKSSAAKPAFLLGKLLDVVLLDQIDYELRQLDILNSLLEAGREAFGEDFDEKINAVVREKRGVGYRSVDTIVINPSEDVGRLAARCYRGTASRSSRSVVSSLLTRAATSGVPEDEADLLSYVFFDYCFTTQLIELGRQDAAHEEDRLLAMLTDKN